MRGEAVAAAMLAVTTLTANHPAAGTVAETCWDSAWRCHDVNAYRADHGAGPLDQRATLQDSAKAWARTMAADGVLRHSGDGLTEIVGYAPDWLTVMAAWDQSPAHREILRDGTLEQVGIGSARTDTGTVFYVIQFR